MLFPESDQQKAQLGLQFFHCYKKSFIQNWEKQFKNSSSYDIQVALVLWTAPLQYIRKGCEGFFFFAQGKYLNEGCYPSKKHMADYEDWVRFTAYFFGKYVDHYVVWNEVDSTDWADPSGEGVLKSDMMRSPLKYMKKSFDMYVQLLKSTYAAVSRLDRSCLHTFGACKNLVYVSMSRDWYEKKIMTNRDHLGGAHISWRGMNLLSYLWGRLGLNYDWALAIHPYGMVNTKLKDGLTFSSLVDLASYQKKQIEKRKSSMKNFLDYPQSRIFASEQNVSRTINPEDWRIKAKFVCESYGIAEKMPEIIAITHNHFQDPIQTNQIDFYTMLPASAGADLSRAQQFETFRAYESTTQKNWDQNNSHYCCVEWQLGCKKT